MEPSASKSRTAEELPPPNAHEVAAIQVAVGQVSNKAPRLLVRIGRGNKNDADKIGPPHNDYAGWVARLESAFGTKGTAFAVSQLNAIMNSCRTSDGGIEEVRVNAMLTMVEAAKPADELQAALAVQMAMTHYLAQESLRRSARVSEIPQFDCAGNMAVKLLRTFTMQVEALAKLQRDGEQTVRVVHVHPGAQAVIGPVNTGTMHPGGGGTLENSNQPHAKEHLPAPSTQPMPEVRRADADGEPVPVARCGGQEALQNAGRSRRQRSA